VKILFLLYDALPAFRPDVAVLFGKELPKLGVTSDLLGQLGSEEQRVSGLEWPAGRVYLHGLSRQGLIYQIVRPFMDLAMVWRLSSEHRVIQVRDKIRTGLLGLLVARLTGRKFTYWMSFMFAEGFKIRHRQVGSERGAIVELFNRMRANWAGKIYYKVLAPRVDHLFVQSDAMLEFMALQGIARNRMTAVPMAVDVDFFRTVTKPVEIPQQFLGRRVIGYLGVLSKSRHSDFMLDVLIRVRETCPDAFLLLAGDGASADEQAWIRREIQRRDLSNHVWLTGWLPQKQALPLLKCADVGLSPFPRDYILDTNSPTKALEYLALGIPCVGNDNPDQQFVLESSGGGLCVLMEVGLFADAILRLLGNSSLAEECSKNGRDWVATHRSYRATAQRVAAVYGRVALSA